MPGGGIRGKPSGDAESVRQRKVGFKISKQPQCRLNRDQKAPERSRNHKPDQNEEQKLLGNAEADRKGSHDDVRECGRRPTRSTVRTLENTRARTRINGSGRDWIGRKGVNASVGQPRADGCPGAASE